MAKYEVTIIEDRSRSKQVEVEADSAEEAKALALESINSGTFHDVVEPHDFEDIYSTGDVAKCSLLR
jgi:3-dehydroquinate synthase class II